MNISRSQGWWHARVSPNGQLIAAGNGRVKLWTGGAEFELGPGYAPQWLQGDQLLIAQQDETHQVIDLNGHVLQPLGPLGANQQRAAVGRYALAGMQRTANRTVLTNFAGEVAGATLPALAPGHFAYVTFREPTPGDYWPHQLVLDDQALWTYRAVTRFDPRSGEAVWTFSGGTGFPSVLASGAIAWLDGRVNYGRLAAAAPTALLSVDPDRRESPAILVRVGDQVWVLSHQDDRLMFRPWGSAYGQHWPIALPENGGTNPDPGTHGPHGVGLDAHHARLAWNDSDGYLHTLVVDDSTPVDLRVPLPTAPPTEPPPIIIIEPPVEPPISPPIDPIDPEPPMPTDPALEARVAALEHQVAALTAQVTNLDADALRDGHTVGLQDHWRGYARSPDAPLGMAPDAPHLGAWEQWRLVRVDAPDPQQDRPLPPLPIVGVVWPTPGPADIGMNREWLAQMRAVGLSTIRTNISILRTRENVLAQCEAVAACGLELLPIIEWPYDTTEPAVAVAFLEWFLATVASRVPMRAIELHNEPWILDRVHGAEYLRVALPLAEAAEAIDPSLRVIVACDLFDHSSGQSRRWPGVTQVLAAIDASPQRYAAIHNYRNPEAADWSAWGSRMAEHDAIVAALGHARYVVTETGWKPAEGERQASGADHIRELEILGAQGIDLAVIYAHLEDPVDRAYDFGLFALGATPDGPLVARPAALALEGFLPVLPPLPTTPEPPDPGPLPELPRTTLGCVDGVHYVQAWLGDAVPSVTAEATAVGAWETWGVHAITRGDAPTVALRADNGCWLTAELDATLSLTRDAREDPGPWEIWTLERQDDTHAALRSHHGGYLRAEGGGGSTVAADGGGLGPWEVFAFSSDLTDPVAPGPGGLPSWDAALDVKGEFLCAPGFEWAFMYPGWSPEDRKAYRIWCRDQGHTHLFFAPWGAYRNEPAFDYRRDPIGFRALIDEAQAEGFVCVVFCLTDSLPGDEGYTEDEAHAFIRDWLSQFNDLVRIWILGWECVQIDAGFDRHVKGDPVVQTVVREFSQPLTPEEAAFNRRRRLDAGTPAPQPDPHSYTPLPPHSDRLYWLWSGDSQLRIFQTMRQTFGADRILGVHYTPERITGWPDYGHTNTDPRGEPDWWWAAGGSVNLILYQRSPTEPDDETVAHTTGGRTADGVDIGDANRIAGACTWQLANKSFTAFEFSRSLARCARLRTRFDTAILAGNGNLGEY
jgi:hypothetical protein